MTQTIVASNSKTQAVAYFMEVGKVSDIRDWSIPAVKVGENTFRLKPEIAEAAFERQVEGGHYYEKVRKYSAIRVDRDEDGFAGVDKEIARDVYDQIMDYLQNDWRIASVKGFADEEFVKLLRENLPALVENAVSNLQTSLENDLRKVSPPSREPAKA